MKTIWKYQLDVTDEQLVPMKQGSQILAVQVQVGIPCIWALVDTSKPSEDRMFCIYGTGHPIEDEPGQFIGTFQLHGGSLSFHLFEVIP